MYALFLDILHASFLNNHYCKILSCWNTLHNKGLEKLNSLRKLFICILLRVLLILYKTKLVVSVITPAIAISLVIWGKNKVLAKSNTFDKNFFIIKISVNAAWLSGLIVIEKVLAQIILLFKRIVWLLNLT